MSLSDEINEVLESEQKEQLKEKFARKLFFRDDNGEVYELYNKENVDWNALISDLLYYPSPALMSKLLDCSCIGLSSGNISKEDDRLEKWSEYMLKSDVSINDFDDNNAFEVLLESCDGKVDDVLGKLIDRESLKLTELGAKFIRNIPCVLDNRINPETGRIVKEFDFLDIFDEGLSDVFGFGGNGEGQKLPETELEEVLEDCRTKIYSAVKYLTERFSWFNPVAFLGIKGGVMGDPTTIAAMALSNADFKTATELPELFEKVFGNTKYSVEKNRTYISVKFQYFFIFCAEKFSTFENRFGGCCVS